MSEFIPGNIKTVLIDRVIKLRNQLTQVVLQARTVNFAISLEKNTKLLDTLSENATKLHEQTQRFIPMYEKINDANKTKIINSGRLISSHVQVLNLKFESAVFFFRGIHSHTLSEISKRPSPLNAPLDDEKPVTHFLDMITDLEASIIRYEKHRDELFLKLSNCEDFPVHHNVCDKIQSAVFEIIRKFNYKNMSIQVLINKSRHLMRAFVSVHYRTPPQTHFELIRIAKKDWETMKSKNQHHEKNFCMTFNLQRVETGSFYTAVAAILARRA